MSFTFAELAERNLVIITVEQDTDWEVENMIGDMFDPQYVTDVAPEDLEQQKNEYIDRLHRDGVWGVTLTVLKNGKHETIESLWGIGSYEYADTEIRKEMEEEAVRYFSATYTRCESCGQISSSSTGEV